MDVSLYDPLTNKPLSISGLTKEVKITFKSLDASSCYYYNKQTKLWDSHGLVAESGTGNELICKSSHLTVFGASNNTMTTTTSEPLTSSPYQGMPALLFFVLLIALQGSGNQ